MEARGANTLAICSASSRVGDSTREVGNSGSARMVRMIRGRPKASVLPEPVGARQQTSLPIIASGMDSL